MKPLRLGTRGSALALCQARAVAAGLERNGVAVNIVTITTGGDRRQTESLAEISAQLGKGVFTKEIDEALLRDEIDLAAHSAKDMAAVARPGLAVAAVLPRADPRDALALPGGPPHAEFAPALLHQASTIGTGSPRRVAQLRAVAARARFEGIRGNVDTRLRKLDDGRVDALVLACAGLLRLGLGHRISAAIPLDICVPAPGQGTIAVQTRTGDRAVRSAVEPLDDPTTSTALAAEQMVVAELGGGCQLPLGVFASVHGTELHLRAVAASTDGVHAVRCDASGPAADPAAVARRLAGELAARGARELLTT